MDTDEETNEVLEAPTTVTLPEAEPANDNADGDGAEPSNDNGFPEDRTTRREKRAQRTASYKEQQTRAADAERRFAAADAERQRLSEAIAELRGRTEAMQRAQYQTQPDPHEAQVSALEAKAQRHLAAAANAKDPATATAEMTEYNKALRSASVMEARRELQGDMQRMARSMPDPAQAGMKVALEADYPWLAGNEAARNAADAYIALLISRDKRPSNLATFREACALAAKDFGLGGAVERPSEARRAAYNGISARNGAGGDDGRTQLQMSGKDAEALRKMAAFRYPALDAEDAYKKWLREHGPALARK